MGMVSFLGEHRQMFIYKFATYISVPRRIYKGSTVPVLRKMSHSGCNIEEYLKVGPVEPACWQEPVQPKGL
jgi:hypothetical protein